MNHKNKTRKPISVLLALLMILSVLAPTAAAADYGDDDVKLPDPVISIAANDYTPRGLDCLEFINRIDFDGLSNYLIEQLSTCPESVDLSMFNLDVDDIGNVILAICDNIPELFHVRFADFSYSYNGNNKITTLWVYNYKYDAATYQSIMQQCEKAGDKLLYDIEGNNSLSELEKAVLIHDRLAVYCEYAYQEYLDGTLNDRNSVYCMDGVLAERMAVCDGYAHAYTYLAKRVGLKSYHCSSDLLWHGWNIVYIDGVPYHLDATWDDPTWDNAGQANHNSLLLSTNAFKTDPSKHNKNGAIDYDETPVATTYDNAYWRNNISSQIVYINGMYYYIDGNATANITLKATPTLLNTSDDTVITAATAYLRDKWHLSDKNSNWTNTYSRLSTDGRNLYFNSSTKVYKYNISTGAVTEFYAPTGVNTSTYTYIYGCYYDGKTLTLDIAKATNSNNNNPTKMMFDGRTKVEILNADCAAGNHINKVTKAAKDATCTEAGWTAETTCMICDAQTASTPINMLPHSYGAWTVATPSTCTVKGSEKRTCSKCNNTETKELALAAHSWTWVTDKAANCGETGLKHQKCANCTATQNMNTVIDATGEHTWEWKIDKAATCGTTGLKHQKCANCTATQNMNTVIDATGNHNYNAVVTKPTCTEKGYTTHTCSVCGNSYTDAETAATGHSWTWVTDTAATCGTTGLKHEKCTKCTATQSMNTIIDATGEHTWNWVTTKEANCKEDGAKHEECATCHSTRNETVINKGDHNFKTFVETVNATCTEQGYTVYKCTACDETTKTNYTTAGGHNWVWTTDKEATCAETGLKHEKCTNCTATQSMNTVIGLKEHAWTWVTDEAATCGATGLKHQKCTNCTATQNMNTIIEATGAHTYTWVTDTQPTCGKTGSKHQVCTGCNATGKTEAIPATGNHAYGDWKVTKNPTCGEAGSQEQTCTVCGKKNTQSIAASGAHNYSGDTCQTCGKKCSCNCHKDGFMGFIWKIQKFFYKLFNNNKTCACGNPHW